MTSYSKAYKFITNFSILVFFLSIFIHPIQTQTDYDQLITSLNLQSRFVEILLVDDDESQILYSKDGQSKLYPASMTKIMTSILAIEHFENQMDQKVILQPQDLANLKNQNASIAGFVVGEEVTVKDLIFGVLIPSGADAVNALVREISGDLDSFLILMKQKAQDLGMKRTNFTNATGLHNDQNYSTAHDINRLMEYSLQNPTFKEFISTLTYRTTPNNKHKNGILFRDTILRTAQSQKITIHYIEGGKTGWVPQSGYNLSSFHTYKDKTLIITTGDAYKNGGNLSDHETIYKTLIEKNHDLVVIKKDEILGEVALKYVWGVDKMFIQSPKDFSVKLPIFVDKEDIQIKLTHETSLEAPIEENLHFGNLSLRYQDDVLLNETLFTNKTYPRSFLLFTTHQIITLVQNHLWLFSIGVVILLILIVSFWLRSYFINRQIRRGDRKWKL